MSALTVPAPPAISAPQNFNVAKISAQQERHLRIAEACGPLALLAFAQAEQRKRDAEAAAQWANYKLFTLTRHRFPSLIVGPKGQVYTRSTASEAYTRFADCPDQVFVDKVNDALRAAGVHHFRLETKHRKIWDLKEQWARENGVNLSGERGWVEA